MFRRGRITVDEADAQLDAIARESGTLREMLESPRAQEALVSAQETWLTETAAALHRLREQLPEIERTDDRAAKRQIIELLVRRIVIRTEGESRHKRAIPTIVYAFRAPSAYATDSGTNGPTSRSSAGRG